MPEVFGLGDEQLEDRQGKPTGEQEDEGGDDVQNDSTVGIGAKEFSLHNKA